MKFLQTQLAFFHVAFFLCVNIFLFVIFIRYIQSLMEILEFLDRNPDDYKVLGQ